MQKYKLIVSDCDFTLLNDRGLLPAENIAIIRKVMDMGIDFVIATGRNDVLAFDYVEEIGRNITVIGCNGATARNPKTGIVYRNEYIPEATLSKITAFLDENHIGYKAYTMDRAYQKGLDLGSKITALTGKKYEKIADLETEDISSSKDIAHLKILKVVVVEEMSRLKAIQDKLRAIDGINPVIAGETVLDIISEKASKGAAVKEYIAKTGVRPSEMIVFGDSENDISMLSLAGLSVCMKNGDNAVKKVCHRISVTDNNNSGVGRTLKEIFDLE